MNNLYLILDGDGPRYAQLIRALKDTILDGRIPTGGRLPATRELARELGMSRNTVMIAYDQLRAEGFIDGRVGSGTRVADLGIASHPKAVRRKVAGRSHEVPAQSRYMRRARRHFHVGIGRQHYGLRYNLQYGEPFVNPEIMNTWRRALARAATGLRFDYPDVRGLPALREAICAYLARRRGIVADRDDVLVVNGAQQAFTLAARLLVDEGETVAFEEPGYFAARQALQAHGARLFAVRADAEGLDYRRLPAHGARLVYVTPSHQFPGGSVMSPARRLGLLRYADRWQSWILEDDYDGEFRYNARPLAALRELDSGDRVMYVGTFSKILFPSLRLGYMVLPRALRRDFTAARYLTDMGGSTIEQAALADFMTGPGFDRHLRQAAAILKARRRALLAGLERHAGERVTVFDSPAGMHVTAWLRDYSNERTDALIEHARRYGLGIYPIAPHYLKPPARPGLLLGYAGLPVEDIEEATRLLGRCLDEVS